MQSIRHTNGSQTHMEPLEVLSMVSSDTDVLVIHDNERSHEKASKGVSTVPGRDWAGSFQETPVNPSKCDHDMMEKSG